MLAALVFSVGAFGGAPSVCNPAAWRPRERWRGFNLEGKAIKGKSKKDKILAVTDGNHERRISRNDNISLPEIMCQQLGIGDLYCPTAVLLFIRVGQMSSFKHKLPACYTIYCSHGAGGGGRTAGGKINRLVDMAAIVDADIYIMSHVHQPAVLRTAYYRVSASNSSVQKVDKLFINTSAALNYGGYGELALYRPASTQTPLLFLNGRRKEATATL